MKYPVCMLFSPSLKEGWAAKAWKYNPDAVIVDLEDSVPETLKKEARTAAINITSQKGLPWFLRINSYSSGFMEDDVSEVLNPNIAGIIVPKVSEPREVRRIESLLAKQVKDHRISNFPMVIPTIETALGLENAFNIAKSSKIIFTLSFGIADLMNDLQLRETLSTSVVNGVKFRLVTAAKAANLKAPQDSPTLNIADKEGLQRDARQSLSLGFGGKHAVHPSQIKIIKDAFAITEQELEKARHIVTSFETAIRSGIAAINVDGEMVDYPVYLRAKRILSISGGD